MAEGSLRKDAFFWASPAPGSAAAADPARQGRGVGNPYGAMVPVNSQDVGTKQSARGVVLAHLFSNASRPCHAHAAGLSEL